VYQFAVVNALTFRICLAASDALACSASSRRRVNTRAVRLCSQLCDVHVVFISLQFRYMTRFLSAVQKNYELTVLRFDYNIDPAAFWIANDGPDRDGVTERLCVEGLYTMWDEILASHPGLLLDSCASGGRRIDLEVLSRCAYCVSCDILMFCFFVCLFVDVLVWLFILVSLLSWGSGVDFAHYGNGIHRYTRFHRRQRHSLRTKLKLNTSVLSFTNSCVDSELLC
jgi:hypothetical protein